MPESPPPGPVHRFGPEPGNVRKARRHVARALAGAPDAVIDVAVLLTSEVVTNAVLHARTDVDVWVDGAPGGRVRVSVRDGDPTRGPMPRDRAEGEDSAGHGLHLVEALAAGYGVEVTPHGKTVWFEVDHAPAGTSAGGSAWEAGDRPRVEGAKVRLAEVPVSLARAAQRHRLALLREAELAIMGRDPRIAVTPAELRRAAPVNDVVSRGLEQALAGVPQSRIAIDCVIEVPPERAADVSVLESVLERLNEAARQGWLLTRPALPEVREFRNWLLAQVAGQLHGEDPVAWRPPRLPNGPLPGAAARGVVPIAERVAATVTADDSNRITDLNHAAEELLGWPADELLGRRITTLIPPEWRDRHVAGFTTFLLTGESRIVGQKARVEALRRDGSQLPVDLLLTVTQSRQGEPVFVAELHPVEADPVAAARTR